MLFRQINYENGNVLEHTYKTKKLHNIKVLMNLLFV